MLYTRRMKVFITGRQGTGKTTVIRELQRRGYTAYNTDELPGVTRLEETATGKPVDIPHSEVDWDVTSWNWQAEALQKLLDSAETVFIGAVVSNQADFYHKFDKMFALIVTPEQLGRNLRAHEHGYDDTWIQRILDHQYRQQKFLDAGAMPLDNNRPVAETVDELLERIDS